MRANGLLSENSPSRDSAVIQRRGCRSLFDRRGLGTAFSLTARPRLAVPECRHENAASCNELSYPVELIGRR